MNISNLILGQTESALLFAELLLIWSAAHYLTVRDKVREISESGQPTKVDALQNRRWLASVFLRAFTSALATAGMTAFTSWTLVGAVFVSTLILPLLRAVINPKYIPELEICMNVGFVATLLLLIDHYHLRLCWSPIKLDVANSRIILTSLIIAIMLFSLRGGTYIVRGILDKTGTLPQLKNARELAASSALAAVATPAQEGGSTEKQSLVHVDTNEYSRGRMIGNLERLLLLVIVAAGSYQSLAFLAAAKGLIRSKDLENRDWAEYFLVGSLASVLVALAGGLLIQQLLGLLWNAK